MARREGLSPSGVGAVRRLGDRTGRPIGDVAPTGAAVWFVGPEGGLTAAEREACLNAGFEPVSLGPRTLRFETAAVAGVAILAAALDSGRREGGARRARKDELGGTG